MKAKQPYKENPMATFYGFSGGDNFTNGTTGNDLFLTVGGGDYVQSTAGNDTFDLGYVKSALYWRYTFNDSDTVELPLHLAELRLRLRHRPENRGRPAGGNRAEAPRDRHAAEHRHADRR